MNTLNLDRLATSSMFPRFVLLLVLSLAASTKFVVALPLVSTTPPTVEGLATLDSDILKIDDRIKAILDAEIRPIRNRQQRAIQLHDLMFARYRWNIKYTSQRTLTAQQAFDYERGNCISLAALYVASARYVGLDAKFQQINIHDNWEQRSNYYVVPGHINAVVSLPGKSIHVEFLQTFFDTEFSIRHRKVISDRRAFAQFRNNIAMEFYDKQMLPEAIDYLQNAVEIDPKIDFIWSNYGVVLKAAGDLNKAEAYYNKALAINPRNSSALTNLFVLFEYSGRDTEADRISKKVDKYNRKNPYYLAKLAQGHLTSGEYKAALKLIRKALRKDSEEAQFYHLQARILVGLGQHKRALASLEKARENSHTVDEIRRYEDKISFMNSAH